MLIAIYRRTPQPTLLDGNIPTEAVISGMYRSYKQSIQLHAAYVGKPIAFRYY